MIFLTKADFTSDANVASEVNPAAFAAVLQLQSGEMDLEITALLDANKRDAAIAKKKEIIVMLVGDLCSGVVFFEFFGLCRNELRNWTLLDLLRSCCSLPEKL